MDFSFIRLLTDFEQAKRNENSPIVSLIYSGIIQQLPNETFTQITAISGGISLLGSLVAELTDSCGNVVKDLDGNFYYEAFTDQNGDNQIVFEFGMVGTDFYTLPLHLKLTDLGNETTYYSNPFLVTALDANKTTRFDYTDNGLLYGIDYQTAPYIQSVRLSCCYDHTPVNDTNFKQYVNTRGFQTNYRNSVTFLRKHLIEYLDNFVNDRLAVLFNHSIIFVNGERVSVSDFKAEERKGDTNYFSGEFTINKLGDIFLWDFQLFEPLEAVFFSTFQNGGLYTPDFASGFNFTEVNFNRDISIAVGAKASLYKGAELIEEVPIEGGLSNQIALLFSVFSNPLEIGEYRFVIPQNVIFSGSIFFKGFQNNDFTFTIAEGEYDATEYDNNDYLTA